MRQILLAIIVALFLFGISSAWAHWHSAYSHDDSTPSSDSDWMGGLPDFLRISELSIPGTHDTMAHCGGDAVACQTLKLPQQLEAGIRALDIRCRRFGMHFDITHSCFMQGDNCWALDDHYEFDDVLSTAVNFLIDHPKETIIMRVQDAGCEFLPFRDFLETFLDYVENQGCYRYGTSGQWISFKDYIWMDDASNRNGICSNDLTTECEEDSECTGGTCLRRAPTLGDVRGKIVILRNFDGADLYGLRWGTNLFDIQDQYNLTTNWDLEDKWNYVSTQFQETNAGSLEKIYINFLSGSGGSFPYFVASGHSSPGTSDPRLWMGYCSITHPCAPFHTNWAKCCYFEGINILAYNYIIFNSPQRVGIVMMDFPGHGLIQAVININFSNHQPVANANGPYVGYEGSAILLDGSDSADADGDELQYRWDFENDATWDTVWSTSPTATYTWYDDHTGDVSLEVTDGKSISTDVAEVTIFNLPPTVNAGLNALIFSGQIFYLRAGFIDPGVNDKPWSFTIDWGDGSNSIGSTNVQGVGTIVGSKKYLVPGTYTIIVSVTDKDGGTGSDVIQLEVKPLTVKIDIKPGSFPNSINPKSKGNIPVGVLSGTYDGINFNATTIIRESLRFAGASAMRIGRSAVDLDRDGDLDMVFHFDAQAVQWSPSMTQACLSGHTKSGTYFEGCDTVRRVPIRLHGREWIHWRK